MVFTAKLLCPLLILAVGNYQDHLGAVAGANVRGAPNLGVERAVPIGGSSTIPGKISAAASGNFPPLSISSGAGPSGAACRPSGGAAGRKPARGQAVSP